MGVFNLTNGDDVFPGAVDNTGADTIDGRGGADLIDAGIGDDSVIGGTGADTLMGGEGADSLFGGSGEDILYGGAGNDLLNGGSQSDTANYGLAAGAVTVDLTMNGAQNTGGSGVDTLINIENVTGSAFADFIRGTIGANLLLGGAGADTLIGRGGDDTLNGGVNTDTVLIAAAAASGIAVQNGTTLTLTTADGVDTLTGIEWIQFAGMTPSGDGRVQVAAGDAILEAGDDADAVSEDATLNSGAAGVLANDLDLDDVKTVTAISGGAIGAAVDGLFGTLTLNADGSYVYVADAATDAMAAGDMLVDSFSYTVSAGGVSDSATLDITITGQNDDPSAADRARSAEEDGPAVTVTAAFDDVDDGDTHSFAIDLTGTLGAVVDNGDGTFDYDAAGAFDFLADGESAIDTFTYTVTDNNGGSSTATATITVNGSNDDPVCAALSAAFDEDGPGLMVTASFTDADTSNIHVYAMDDTGTLGTVTNNGDGTFGYDATGLCDALGVGETLVDTFTYRVTDNHGGFATELVTITINGRNDDPLASAVAGLADERGPAVSVAAAFADVDANDTHFYGVDVTGTLGLVVDNGDGTFDYDANGAFEHLAVGETATDTFTYTVTDNHGGFSTETVTMTVIGRNDRPEAAKLLGAAHEDGPAVTLAASFTDADASDTHTFSVNDTGTLGAVTNNGDGTFDYDASGAFDFLNDGETAVDTFAYTVADNRGGSSTKTVTVVVEGEDERVVGSILADLLNGGAFDDQVFAFGGADVIDGKAGDDEVRAGDGDDKVNGSSGADVLLGADGDDRLGGDQGDDIVVGGDGDDVIEGGANNDVLIGSGGTDVVSYAGAFSGVSLILKFAGIQDTGGAGGDKLSGFENALGSAFADHITGSSSGNVLDGGLGADTLRGSAGADTLHGGKGADLLAGGAHDDTATYWDATSPVNVNLRKSAPQNTGGGGIDTLLSIERVVGSDGADTLTGSRFDNTLSGGQGDDVLTGGKGGDRLLGGDGSDTFVLRRVADFRGGLDVIADLEAGDVIDLSGLDAVSGQGGDQAFALVVAFDGTAGQAMLDYVPGVDVTLLRLDVDGDANTDFTVAILGDHEDFVGFVL